MASGNENHMVRNADVIADRNAVVKIRKYGMVDYTIVTNAQVSPYPSPAR